MATQNGTVNTAERMSVKEIKEKAIETVARELRGVSSAATMLKAARTQYYNGREHEDGGNLKDAFSAYIKVAKLLQMTMQLPEAKSDRSKTAIAKEIGEFLEVRSRFLVCAVLCESLPLFRRMLRTLLNGQIWWRIS